VPEGRDGGKRRDRAVAATSRRSCGSYLLLLPRPRPGGSIPPPPLLPLKENQLLTATAATSLRSVSGNEVWAASGSSPGGPRRYSRPWSRWRNGPERQLALSGSDGTAARSSPRAR